MVLKTENIESEMDVRFDSLILQIEKCREDFRFELNRQKDKFIR